MQRIRRFSWRTWWPVLLLGLTTIGAYGLVLYAFGLLIEPIHDEMGWSNGAVSAAFSISALIGGLGAFGSGWLVDRIGGRPVMLSTLAAGSALLLAAASARELWLFLLAWGAGGGLIGAGLYYNVTMAITARLYFRRRAEAFALLTFLGGLASPVFFPLGGFLVDAMGWRDAVRVLVVVMAAMALPGALLVRAGAAPIATPHEAAPAEGYASVREAFRAREVLQMIAMFTMAGLALGALQVHHVPAIQATGVALTTAATIAAIRGFLSLPGRALLAPAVNRLGLFGAIGLVYAALVVGIGLLMAAGSIGFVYAFAALTGLAFGAVMPLHGLFATEVFGERRIGSLMGAQTAVGSMATAAGPLLIGLTVDAAGSYLPALALMAGCQLLALGLLWTHPRRAARPATAEVGVPNPATGR